MEKNLLNDSLFLEKGEVLTESHRSLILERLSNLDFIKKHNDSYGIKISEFVKNLSLEELVCLYNNVIKREFAIKFAPILSFINGRFGYYDFKTNNITYYLSTDAVMHEFIHLASSNIKKTNNITYKSSGFARIIESDSTNYFGIGLTEGYADLLTLRLLNKKSDFASAYSDLVKITKIIELFFKDKDELRKMFFRNDINAFLEHMSSYVGKKSAIKLVAAMDIVRDREKDYKKSEKKDITNMLIEDLSTILISTVKDKSVLLELKDILETSELKEETTLKLLK